MTGPGHHPSAAAPSAPSGRLGRLLRGWRELSPAWRDGLIIGAVWFLALLLASVFDAYEALQDTIAAHESWQLDEIITLGALTPFALIVFAARRLRELRQEIGRRSAAESAAFRLALHDPLTGLANRRLLAEQGALALARMRREGGGLAVLVLDLDRFKPVNDLYGHAAGDAVLREVAARLRENLREDDLAARAGGDEFVVVCREATQGAATETAARLARRLIALLSEPIPVATDTSASVGVSIGIASAPGRQAVGFETLLLQADAALYRAKAEGRGEFRFHEPGLDAELRERARVEAELRRAIPAGEIRAHFQPVVNLQTGLVASFEVLARWHHPTRGTILPGEFIHVAEDSGLIGPLTDAVIRDAVQEAAGWGRPLPIAVNLSPRLLHDRDLPDRLIATLEEAGFEPGRLEIEVTETAVTANVGRARAIVAALKARGIQLVMDDFGTGYSSLANLRALPFDRIKIDRSFVAALGSDPECERIVAAVLALGHGLGLQITAEGIEDGPTAARLRDAGCNSGQGWYFGGALTAAQAALEAAGAECQAEMRLTHAP